MLLNITVNQDKVSQLTVQQEPAISTREINTKVIVNDKQTVVLGGIYEESKDKVTERIPVLGSIPFLGGLFTYKHTANERKELLIFITPKIVK
jgi:type IV pilus assembly protein PilQ